MFGGVGQYSGLSGKKGMSGLASGIDTDKMIEAMTAATRNKITKELQRKQIEEWRQESYRGIITKMTSFKDKYFSYSKASSIFSTGFFDSGKVASSSDYVKVTGNTQAAKNMEITDIIELAKNASLTSTSKVTGDTFTTGTITDKVNTVTVSGKTFSVTIDGKATQVKMPDPISLIKVDTSLPADEQARMNAANATNIANAMNYALNEAGIGDKLEFSVDVDAVTNAASLKIENTAGMEIKVEVDDPTGNLATGLGFTDATIASGATYKHTSTIDSEKFFGDVAIEEYLSGSTLTFKFNGVDKTITFDESDKSQFKDAAGVANYLNNKIASAIGNKVTVSLNAKDEITFRASDPKSGGTDVFAITGSSKGGVLGTDGALKILPGASNRINMSASLDDFAKTSRIPLTASGAGLDASTGTMFGMYKMEVNGKTLEFKGTMSVQEMLNQINNSGAGVKVTYSTTMNTFSATATEMGAVGQTDFADYTDTGSGKTSNLATVLFGDPKTDVTKSIGQDSLVEMKINGVSTTITRASNTFSIDGVNIELVGKADGATKENVKFNVTSNVDEVVKRITEFVNDYNEVIELTSQTVNQRADKDKKYPPLTAEQRKEMSEDEIKAWETKAKEGLLYQDMTLSNVVTSFRMALIGPVSSDGTITALSKIGIAPAAFAYTENGKLHIDEDTLKKAVTESPDMVKDIFTKSVDELGKNNPDTGVARRLNTLFEAAVGTFGDKGILINIAGVKDSMSERDSAMYKRIDLMNKNLDSLGRKLKLEENRYYKQFTAMEKYLQAMNSQSEWLTQQLGG